MEPYLEDPERQPSETEKDERQGENRIWQPHEECCGVGIIKKKKGQA